MKPLLGLLAGFIMIAGCYAYPIMTTENVALEMKQKLNLSSLKLQETLDVRLPAKSAASPGPLTLQPVDKFTFSHSFFIIGDDVQSRQWLVKHADYLKTIKALGFITNIENSESYEALQVATQLPLLPANVDDLMLLLGANHYPLIFHEGVVWQ